MKVGIDRLLEYFEMKTRFSTVGSLAPATCTLHWTRFTSSLGQGATDTTVIDPWIPWHIHQGSVEKRKSPHYLPQILQNSVFPLWTLKLSKPPQLLWKSVFMLIIVLILINFMIQSKKEENIQLNIFRRLHQLNVL